MMTMIMMDYHHHIVVRMDMIMLTSNEVTVVSLSDVSVFAPWLILNGVHWWQGLLTLSSLESLEASIVKKQAAAAQQPASAVRMIVR
jgi:hypothetical protein